MADITPIASLNGELAMPEKVWMQGPQGPKGDPGAAATVTVGTVTTGEPGTDAIVTNRGTENAAVLDFIIPRGENGAGVPDGGTVGQLLSKTETGTAWIDHPQSGVQPDWNQNDETAADFVKNRPFYTGNPVETVLVEESTVSFADNGGTYIARFLSTFVATVGETYKVYWDGTVYECTCAVFSRDIVIGNLSIMGVGSDTGEPFVMLVYSGEGIQIATADTSASHTFSISAEQTSIVKIPAKFIDKDASGYIVVHNSSTMTEEEVQNYISAISKGEAVFIIWESLYISLLFVNTVTDSTGVSVVHLGFETPNGERYDIVQNSEGLFKLGDRKLSLANFPVYKNTGIGEKIPGILIKNNQLNIAPSTHSSGVGTTDILFSVNTNGAKSKSFDVLGNGEAVAPALILYSSTANSTKKFKITVDDSGTISATEVT